MSSIFGDLPETPFEKACRFLGYCIAGIVFGVGPSFVVFILTDQGALKGSAVNYALITGAGCVVFTLIAGMKERLQFASRLFSLVVYFSYIGLNFAHSPEAAFRAGINLIFPMVCIWFGKQMGESTGDGWATTPGPLVVFGGWLFLIGVPVISGVLRTQLR